MKIKIDVDAWERETHREPGNYGDWSAEGGINGVSAHRVSPDTTAGRGGVYDMPETEVGHYVFAVVAHYGTGDSFGYQAGGEYQVVGAYTTAEEADEAKRVCDLYSTDKVGYGEFVRKQQGLSRSKASVSPSLVVHGQAVYPRWDGYFESLNEIRVWLCRVEP